MLTGAARAATAVRAATQPTLTTAVEFPNQAPDPGRAFKAGLARLDNGTLVVVSGDGVAAGNMVHDVQGDIDRPARDVFVLTCASASDDCSVETDWTLPLNLSGKAALSSIDTGRDGDTGPDNTRKPCRGDSDQPNIGTAGTRRVASRIDTWYRYGVPPRRRRIRLPA